MTKARAKRPAGAPVEAAAKLPDQQNATGASIASVAAAQMAVVAAINGIKEIVHGPETSPPET